MKVLFKILKYFLALVVILGAVSFFLPSESQVSRSINISAPPEKVYLYVNSMKQFNKWSPWFDLDPDADISYTGPVTGVGSAMEWSSDDPSVGKGKQWIVNAVENELIETSLAFDGQGDANARWVLEPDLAGTRISWEFSTEWGYNPVGRYMGLMMDKWVGDAYEDGLMKLKSLVENE